MKTFRQHITEANPMRDAQFRGEAANAWFKLINAIQDGHSKQQAMASSPKRVILDFGKVIGNPQYSPLKIIFAPKMGGVNGQFGFEPDGRNDKPIIALYGVDEKTLSQDDKFLEFLLMYRTKFASTFAHEFTHYLDWKRMGKKKWDAASDDLDDPYGVKPEVYFNNPVEYNAFFQQGTSNVLHALQHARMWPDEPTNKTFMKAITGGYRSFEKAALPLFRDQFIAHMNPTMKRKFLARLYQFWTAEIRGIKAT